MVIDFIITVDRQETDIQKKKAQKIQNFQSLV